jgi:hypothetical protein
MCVLALGVVGCSETPGGQVFPCTEQGIRDAIAVGGGPHTFDCDDATTIVTEEEIVLDNDVILDGQGNLTVDGNDQHRLFSVPQGVTAQLLGMTVTRGAPKYEPGGGIYNEGTLTLADSTVTGNEAEGDGGGILTRGALTLINSTVAGNTTGPVGNGTSKSEEPRAGGGIEILVGGRLTLINSTVSGNTSKMGGGIGSNGSAMLMLTNSTVSGNTAKWLGGGIYNPGDAILINSTLSGNTAPAGGGIYNINHWTPIVLTNVTVSGNTADQGGGIWNKGEVVSSNSLFDDDCRNDGSMTSNGYNIESPGDTCGFDQGTDQADVTAEELNLGELADNGGPTMTHAITTDSAAFNAGTCELDTDQRGQPRPETGGTMCDVGSVEVQP